MADINYLSKEGLDRYHNNITNQIDDEINIIEQRVQNVESSIATGSTSSLPPGLITGYVTTGQLADTTLGSCATAEGVDTTSSNDATHAEGYQTTASGKYSHAEGNKSVASGSFSHAEGTNTTTASGNYSHAEGSGTKALGHGSHSEGSITKAEGLFSHAEGCSTTASNQASHAEGYGSKASGDYSHAEGYYSMALDKYTHAEGYYNTAIGEGTHAEGWSKNRVDTIITDISSSTTNTDIQTAWETNKFSLAKGRAAHIEGYNCLALGNYSHAEGDRTIAQDGGHAEGNKTIAGSCCHAEGSQSQATGMWSHAEGVNTLAQQMGSHAEGYQTKATGHYAHAEGKETTAGENAHAEGRYTQATGIAHAEGESTKASGTGSHAEGYHTTASGSFSHAEGKGTIALGGQHAQGCFNDENIATDNYSGTGTAFVIGNGANASSKSNAFRVQSDGAVYAKSAYNATGADYAEFFEWADGNPSNEDRRGYFVTFDEDKPNMIRKAKTDEYILGIISGNPCVVGNSDESWLGRYMMDDFGSFIYEDKEIEEIYRDDSGEEKTRIIIVKFYKENPAYDPERQYSPRAERQEWEYVGMTGVLPIRDDGTCVIGGYCKCDKNGIATFASNTELHINKFIYRVIERVNENIIKVVLK